MFFVALEKNKAWVMERDLLTTGSIGQTVELAFSDDWDGLEKFAVWRAYDISVAAAISGDTIEIPARVLTKPDVQLLLGIYGINTAGTVVIPTVYADLGTIREGANLSGADNYEVPSEALLAQMQQKATAAAAAALEAVSGHYAGSATFTVNDAGHLIMTVTMGGETSSTDLGVVTAYAEAVAGGYTGTYAEFQALLTANARTAYDVDAALAAVQQVTSTASAAQSAASAAQTAASSAQSAASDAQTAVAGKQAKHTTAQVILSSGGTSWTDIPASGVTSSNTVIWSPDPDSFTAAAEALVRMTAQGNGVVSFASVGITSAAITINMVILD